jgi:membrane protein YdbS with pleckstrin-like domain
MYQRLATILLRWLRVPHEPEPPPGDQSSLRVFRAGRNFLNLKLCRWGFAQLLAFSAIIFWVFMFVAIEAEVRSRRVAQIAPATLTADSFAKNVEAAGRQAAKTRQNKFAKGFAGWFAGAKQGIVQVAMSLPAWAFPVLWIVKLVGILVYLVQLPLTYFVARLDYELRWYMVTDRSLRIRHGVWKVSESTMSFANIQQVVVSQGPLQRLLGIYDVKVQSAGGGGGGGSDSHGNPKAGEDMHLGLFHSVTNGSEIRDLILDRLRRFRESGLGDPDEKASAVASPEGATVANDLLAAAREFAAEARALRSTLV